MILGILPSTGFSSGQYSETLQSCSSIIGTHEQVNRTESHRTLMELEEVQHSKLDLIVDTFSIGGVTLKTDRVS